MIPAVGQNSLAMAAAAYYNATQMQGGCAGDAGGSMSPLSTLAAAAGSRGAGAVGQPAAVAAAGGGCGQGLFGMGVPFQMPAASGVGFGVGGLVGGYGAAAGGWAGGAYAGGAASGAYGYSPYAYGMGGAGAGLDLAATRRKNATKETTSTLKAWLQEHIKNPYPTKGEKIMCALRLLSELLPLLLRWSRLLPCACALCNASRVLCRLAIITKMTLTQVSTWFANARRRLKKENKMTWAPRNRIDSESLDADAEADADADADDQPASAEPTLDKLPRLDVQPDARPQLQQRPVDAPKDPLQKDSGTILSNRFASLPLLPLLSAIERSFSSLKRLTRFHFPRD